MLPPGKPQELMAMHNDNAQKKIVEFFIMII
jgi:hypothetical protein